MRHQLGACRTKCDRACISNFFSNSASRRVCSDPSMSQHSPSHMEDVPIKSSKRKQPTRRVTLHHEDCTRKRKGEFMDFPRRSRPTQVAVWMIKWAWRALVVLIVVTVSKFFTSRIEGIQSFEGRNCTVRLVRAYSDFGLFEVTDDYTIRFGDSSPKPGKSISTFTYDLPPRYQLKVQPKRSIMNSISVTFSDTEAIVKLPGIVRFTPEPPAVTVRVPFSLCGTSRGAMGDG
jgi:hypothetical protein